MLLPSSVLEPPRAPLRKAILAVDGSRAIGFERDLRLLSAIGADHVKHLPGPAVEPPPAASVSVHFSNSLCQPLSEANIRKQGVDV